MACSVDTNIETNNKMKHEDLQTFEVRNRKCAINDECRRDKYSNFFTCKYQDSTTDKILKDWY